jgi:hypothetical protein
LDNQDFDNELEYLKIKNFLNTLESNSLKLNQSENFLIGLLKWKETYSITNNSFSALLKLLNETLGINLPSSSSKNTSFTLYSAEKTLNKIIPLQPKKYDCCPNGHMCFTGNYSTLESCLYCGEKRYLKSGKTKFQFQYWSPLQQIRIEMLSDQKRKSFLYKHEFIKKYPISPSSSIIEDFFNGKHFYDINSLINMENEFDFCFSISTDGFQAFKK